MKIGIVGPADRAVAWENHIRPHHSVSEVVITAHLRDIGDVDACLLLDESDRQLDFLLQAIHSGYHTYLVSRLPTDRNNLEKIYHAAEEANVLLQFSHWPTLAPASQWMAKRIPKPSFLQVVREISYTHFREMEFKLEDFWVDELAFCLKWIDGAVHHMDFKTAELPSGQVYALQLFIRFDSGATASIYINTSSAQNRHQRFASSYNYMIDCDVLSQTVRLGQENSGNHLYFSKETFDASKAAELSVTQFIKSIQMKKPTVYNGYDLLKLANEIDKIRKRIDRL